MLVLRHCLATVPLGLAMLSWGGAASAGTAPAVQPWTLGVSAQYTNGASRDLQASKALSIVWSARRDWGPWQLAADAPYLVLNENIQGSVSTVRGWGDATLRLRRTLAITPASLPALSLTMKVKTASANASRGLGTGATDVSLQLDAQHRQSDVLWFGHVGKRRTGQSSALPRARHPLYSEWGAQTELGSGMALGAFHAYRQANGRSGHLSEVTVYHLTRWQARSAELSLTKGLSAASPHWAVGVAFAHRF